MVAEGLGPTPQMGQHINFSTNERRTKGKSITTWAPRANPSARDTWQTQVREAMRTAVPSIPKILLDGPPTLAQIKEGYPRATTSEQETEYERALGEYQALNTYFWDIMEESIDLAGPYEKVDRLDIQTAFMNDDLRDGVGLFKWALDKAASNPITDQIEATRALSEYKPLVGSASVTQVQLDMHMNGLLEAWLAVSSNDPLKNKDDFRHRLLSSLAATIGGVHG